MLRSLVGSEMCIRDRATLARSIPTTPEGRSTLHNLTQTLLQSSSSVPSSATISRTPTALPPDSPIRTPAPSSPNTTSASQPQHQQELLPLPVVKAVIITSSATPVSYTHLTLPTKRIV
eukprot:TRINITY_DN21662_c0_g1_i1.p1 TRINITY_DN21662_c0_g1~~TRINITY_DN21662_c0_g1_i1.p1  ORF type:complete len:136 (+),score=41.39 TRINITY_DN21662_c0_g1_i1:53-409(+)